MKKLFVERIQLCYRQLVSLPSNEHVSKIHPEHGGKGGHKH